MNTTLIRMIFHMREYYKYQLPSYAVVSFHTKYLLIVQLFEPNVYATDAKTCWSFTPHFCVANVDLMHMCLNYRLVQSYMPKGQIVDME